MIALEAQQLRLPVPPGTGPRRRLRPDTSVARWWQVAVAGLGLVLLLPVSAVIAMLIKLTSRGPIVYRGQRVGRNMEPFSIYKFRTLLVNAEARIGARLLTPGDPLYTPIGRFLKRTKLDEIPQLWNVVRGDMNLVGPRPIRPVFLATSLKEIRDYGLRFVVRPGMTGLAQLRGVYFTHPRDKLRYDLLYIANRSAWFDFKLVLATFVKLVNRWLSLGLLLALVFLSASFLPGLFRGPAQVSFGGLNLSLFEVVGLLAAVAVLARQIPSHRLYLYRTPTNKPILAFSLLAVVAGLVAGDLTPRLHDAAYFTARGFLLVFLVLYLNVWILAWLAHAAVHAPRHLFDGNVYYPAPDVIVGSEHMLAHLPVTVPVLAATGNALTGLKAMALEGFVAAGLAMFAFVYHRTRDATAELLAGAAYAFTPVRVQSIPQLQYLGTQYLPLALLAVDLVVERGGRRAVLGLAAALAMQALACVYVGYFTFLVVPVYALVRLAGVPAGRRLVTGAAVVLAIAAAALLLVPVALPYLRARSLGVIPPHDEVTVLTYSWAPWRWLTPAAFHKVGVVSMLVVGVDLLARAHRRLGRHAPGAARSDAALWILGARWMPCRVPHDCSLFVGYSKFSRKVKSGQRADGIS